MRSPAASQLLGKAASSFLIALALFALMQRIVLAPLSKDAVLMAHLDPTDIISQPLPLRPLIIYASSAISSIILVSASEQLMEKRRQGGSGGSSNTLPDLIRSVGASFVGIVSGGLLVFSASILCGASPWADVSHTFVVSLYVAALAFGPALVRPGMCSLSSWALGEQFLRLIRGPQSTDASEEWLLPREQVDRLGMYGTFTVMVPFLILLVLDHGDQIQRWPVPVLLGSSIGFGAGTIAGVGVSILDMWLSRKRHGEHNETLRGSTVEGGTKES